MNNNGREYEVVLIPDEGYVRTFHFDKELTPLYILKTKHAIRYAGYRMISKDLSLVFEVLKELVDTKPKSGVVIQSLSFTAIITYGKCFTSAEGRRIKLDEGALKGVNEELNLVHKNVIEMRHSYVAHGGIGDFEKNPVCVAFHPTQPGKVLDIYDNVSYTSSILPSVPLFLELIIALDKYVNEKIGIHEKKMKEELFKLKLSEIWDKVFNPRNMEKFILTASGVPAPEQQLMQSMNSEISGSSTAEL